MTANQRAPSGQATDIQAGLCTIQVPVGAFSDTVTLQVFTGDPSNLGVIQRADVSPITGSIFIFKRVTDRPVRPTERVYSGYGAWLKCQQQEA